MNLNMLCKVFSNFYPFKYNSSIVLDPELNTGRSVLSVNSSAASDTLIKREKIDVS